MIIDIEQFLIVEYLDLDNLNFWTYHKSFNTNNKQKTIKKTIEKQ